MATIGGAPKTVTCDDDRKTIVCHYNFVQGEKEEVGKGEMTLLAKRVKRKTGGYKTIYDSRKEQRGMGLRAEPWL